MQKFPLRIFMACFLAATFTSGAYSENIFVCPEGDDSDSGTELLPFRSIEKAVETSLPGDTIFLRAGTYPSTATIRILKSGTTEQYHILMSYPGERAVLDFSEQPQGSSNRGITLSGSYWHIEGIDITRAGDNGLKIEGGNWNRIVRCNFYRNRDSGLQMGQGASYNRVINCDSYYNADPPDFGDADGFAAKLDVGIENYFYGCRAWLNCDDGWDGYMRGADNASTIAENSWAFGNGYLEDGTDPGSQANGNGFKMGGSDDKTLSHDYTLYHCLAFKNKSKGFDQNSNMGSMIMYNCTGHNNLNGNYVIYKTLAPGKELVLKNCLALGNAGSIAAWAVQEANSWMEGFEASEADFLSILDTAAYGPRKADGSLPDIGYMHLSDGSGLINAGVDVGLPYFGSAPDLGCFESEYPGSTGLHYRIPDPVRIACHPNPATERVTMVFSSDFRGEVAVDFYDLSGRLSMHVEPGIADGSDMTVDVPLHGLPPGFYLYRVRIEGRIIVSEKLSIR